VQREEPVGLREGFGQAASAYHHGGAVAAWPDPQHEVTVLDAREPDQLAARPNSAMPTDASS
jgi:hypothetical protein